jgi:murein DD-endopeptidase MepM/ murein hydrolase activator NlpD
MVPRLLAASLLLSTACASTRPQQKLSFTEAFGEDYAALATPVPLAVAARPAKRDARRPKVATTSTDLQAALVAFAARARLHRAAGTVGAPMPLVQAENWEQVSAALEHFLQRAPEETSSFDLIRARVTLEAELELDARAYGDFPADRAEQVLEQVTRLAIRMAQLRQLKVQTHDAPVVFEWPVQPVAVTSLFGRRLHPITRTYRLHFGIDLAAEQGQLVSASALGTVVRAEWTGAHGLHVELQHAGGVVTRYSHLSQLLVEVGTRVGKGDPLGLAGSTGSSTGPHLHFEFWRDGKAKDPLEELGPQARPAVAAL